MAQASQASTTTGAPGGIPAAAQFTPIKAAHADLVASLMGTRPHAIVCGRADFADVTERSEHLQAVLTAVQGYVDAVIQDTADKSPVRIDQSWLSRVLIGGAEEVAGELERCAEALRANGYRRAAQSQPTSDR